MSSWFSSAVFDFVPRARLLCFPCAGAGGASYAAWRRDLKGAGIDLRTLQLPGREARLTEAPWRDLPALVARIAGELASLDDLPFAIFGHSMGALIAFELVRHLRAQRRPLPQHLMVAGCNAPHLPRLGPLLYLIPDDRLFVDAVSRKYGGIPPSVLAFDELRRLMVPALRADLEIVEAYAHRAATPLPVPITAYGGSDDRGVSEYGLTAWQQHTTAEFSWQVLDGDHFFVHAPGSALLDAVRTRMLQLATGTPQCGAGG